MEEQANDEYSDDNVLAGRRGHDQASLSEGGNDSVDKEMLMPTTGLEGQAPMNTSSSTKEGHTDTSTMAAALVTESMIPDPTVVEKNDGLPIILGGSLVSENTHNGGAANDEAGNASQMDEESPAAPEGGDTTMVASMQEDDQKQVKNSVGSFLAMPDNTASKVDQVDEDSLSTVQENITLSNGNTTLKTESLEEMEPEPLDVETAAASYESDTSSEDDLKKESPIEPPPTTTARRRFPTMLVAGFLLLAISIAVPLAIILTSQSTDSTDTPSHEDYEVPTGELVPGIANYTLETMFNPFSPQAMAYDFIANDPDWDTYDDWRKQQRFAMACIFYSFSKRFPLYHDRHECDWRYRRQVTLCTEAGHVRGLSWTNMMWTEINIDPEYFFPPEIALLSSLQRLDLSDSVFRKREDGGGHFTHTELDHLIPLNFPNVLPAVQVIKIMGCTGLQGSLPSTLGLLSSLTGLYLGDNEFTSSIPSELGLLTKLARLDLSTNDLSSTIPSELGRLDDLSALMVQSNNLSGSIPDELGDLPLLNVFDAEDNNLEYFLPSGFCNIGPMAQLSTDWCWETSHCCS